MTTQPSPGARRVIWDLTGSDGKPCQIEMGHLQRRGSDRARQGQVRRRIAEGHDCRPENRLGANPRVTQGASHNERSSNL